MTRVYKSTPPSAGPAPPGPRPGVPARLGIQVVTARAPRVGPSAAELDGVVVPPLRLADGLPEYQRDEPGNYAANLQANGTSEPQVFDDDRCVCCAGLEATTTLLVTVGRAVLCDVCVMSAVDAVRAELPRRRLRLAMERLAAGTVSIETVEAIERMVPVAAPQTDAKT